MPQQDWFRNADWNVAIEGEFVRRLGRARQKSQYLRIQANTLARSHPHVALRLLDQYFALGEHFDTAQAYLDRAAAYEALADTEAAVAACETALEREHRYPQVKTDAYLALPSLIVAHRLTPLYARAMAVLEEHKDRPMFPVEHYRAEGCRALILAELGDMRAAGERARRALAAAAQTHSGFRYHPDLGLVGEVEDEFGRRLTALAGDAS